MLERTYIIPLRKEWLKAPAYKRAKRAVTAVRDFLARHMKSEDVRILPDLNMAVWADGIRSPPPRIKVRTVRDDNGTVWGQLFGKKIPAVDKEEKPAKKAIKAVKKEIEAEKTAKAAETSEAETPEKPASPEEKHKEKPVPNTPAKTEKAATKPAKKTTAESKETQKKSESKPKTPKATKPTTQG